MIDEDREAGIQEFVQGILQALHRATRGADDYRADFHAIALVVLAAMATDDPPHVEVRPNAYELVDEHVLRPVRAFAMDGTETRLILLRVFEGVFGSVSSGIHADVLTSAYRVRETA